MVQQVLTQNNTMIEIEKKIRALIAQAFEGAEVQPASFVVEHPVELSHGDYSTNVALVVAKQLKAKPVDVAKLLVEKMSKALPPEIASVSFAGPGFINFSLTSEFFRKSVVEILDQEESFGKNKNLAGKKVVIEYTDPNPFKVFHIGHLMANTVGEIMSRLLDWNGAEVTRVCYQGDVGLHIAKSLWGVLQTIDAFPAETAPLSAKTKYLGDAYVLGSTKYEDDAIAKKEIEDINKKVYTFFDEKGSIDSDLERLYETGKKWSMQHFDEIYAKLGTHFNHFIGESSVANAALEIVRKNIGPVFEESDGAIVYKGEQDGLHTRVFINSLGLPTYDAKDIGLAFRKEKIGHFDQSIVITASEQQEYFKVMLAALAKIDAKVAAKTKNITHGMMQFADGKMSSRKGNVVSGDGLLAELADVVSEKIADRNFEATEAEEVKTMIAVAALKYSVLKQSPGKNIIFDREKALSFEGDSGPYIQYSCVRAKSVLEKAHDKKLVPNPRKLPEGWATRPIEKMLYRFPELVEKALVEVTPQNIVTYVTQLAAEFNSFYANEQIMDGTEAEGYRLAIVRATLTVMTNCLAIMGVRVPKRM